MYVLKSNSGSNDRFFPADRCTYLTAYSESSGGYVVVVGSGAERAQFFDGSSATGVDLPGNGSSSTRPQLGYIGKTGRFVAITQP